MNKKVKILTALLLTLLLALSAAVFAACDKGEGDTSPKTVTVYLGDKKIEYTTSRAYMFDVFNDMVAEGTIFQFTYTGSVTSAAKDAFVTKIDDLSPAYGTTEYIAFYHSIDDVTLKDMSGFVPDETRDGKTLYYSSVGAMLLPARDKACYLFLIKSY